MDNKYNQYGPQGEYGQQPYGQNGMHQLPPAVQPIIINTAEQQPPKKVIDVDSQQYRQPAQPAQPNVPPDSVMTSTTTTTTRVEPQKNGGHRDSGNGFYDVDGFYDSYSGGFNPNK